MKENIRWVLPALMLGALMLPAGCGYVAAGVAGAVVQDEISDRRDEDEERARNQ